MSAVRVWLPSLAPGVIVNGRIWLLVCRSIRPLQPMGGQASVVLTQPDGRILEVGQGFTNSTSIERIVIARLLPS